MLRQRPAPCNIWTLDGGDSGGQTDAPFASGV